MEGSDREIVQRAFEAFGRGDIDGVVELCDPDIVVRDPERTGTTFREEYRSELVDITEAEGEILVRAHQTGKGKLSGIEINQDLFIVVRLRDGKFTEYRLYTERGGALASIGAAA